EAGNFEELASFQKNEQTQLLLAADRKAFAGWRSVLLFLSYSTLFSGSVAAGRALSKVGVIPDSLWMIIGVSILFLYVGTWAIRRFESYRVRRFLRHEIDEHERIGS